MQKLDMRDKEIHERICRILVDIAIYAKQRGMSVVCVFRGIERAFREFPDNQGSFMPQNHKKFYDMMIARVPKKLSAVCDNVSSSDPNFFHAVAEALSLFPDEFLKNFSKDFFIRGLTGPYCVTDRIKSVWWPSRFITISDFMKVNFVDDKKLYPCERERIHGSVIGRVVDTMTRWKLSGNKEEAFYYAFLGAKNAGASDFARAKMWLRHIRGLGDTSLVYATKLSAYEVWYRNPYQAMLYGADLFVEPQFTALNNIRAFIERSVKFFEEYSPCVKSGFSFETDGYTRTVTSGDGDYLSADTLWDMKVLRNSPETKYALQVLMYWIMGQHSGQEIFKNIKKIGIYNPRMNVAYILEVSKIRPEIIRAVEDDVICY